MKIPYGRSNFEELRRRGFFYVDKTPFLPLLESDEAGYAYLLFLRPRRMGKSLLASTLESYYDLLRADQFDEIFRGLWIHEHPTPERNSYLVLPLDFSAVAADRDSDGLVRTFFDVVKQRVYTLAFRYRERIPEMSRVLGRIDEARDPEGLLGDLMAVVSATGHKLYVIIDEYDHFANRLLAGGSEAVYESAVKRTGFVRSFYATLKLGTQSGAVGRIFVTGVSPILLDDLSSGFNIVTNISNQAAFNSLAGFSHADVVRAVDELLASRPDVAKDPRIADRASLLDVLERYYDGYRFSEDTNERVFNSDMALYFLRELATRGRYPRHMLDLNVRTAYQQLQHIGALSGAAPELRRAVLEQIVQDGHIDSPLLEQFGFDPSSSRERLVSLLYYLGMLTLGDAPLDSAVTRLQIPNRVIRELHWEHLAHTLAEQDAITIDASALESALQAMGVRGDIQPLIDLFQERAVRAMGLKDLRKLDERSLKLMLMTFISLSRMFHVLSEKELAQGYCDLFLGDSGQVPGARYAWMLELKYLPTGAGEPAIDAAFVQAESQLQRYASDGALLPVLTRGRSLKAGSLVFLGAKEIRYRSWSGDG